MWIHRLYIAFGTDCQSKHEPTDVVLKFRFAKSRVTRLNHLVSFTAPSMYLRSSFPPIPNVPTTNYLYTVFPEGSSEDSKTVDYTIHIDAVTGQRRSVKEFARDVFDAITVFGMDRSYGGLKLENQHRVGILSDNCMVCSWTILHFQFVLTVTLPQGIYHDRSGFNRPCRPFRTLIAFCNPMGTSVLSEKGGRNTCSSTQSLLFKTMSSCCRTRNPRWKYHTIRGQFISAFDRTCRHDTISIITRFNSTRSESENPSGTNTTGAIWNDRLSHFLKWNYRFSQRWLFLLELGGGFI